MSEVWNSGNAGVSVEDREFVGVTAVRKCGTREVVVR
jgi:hypothetical protein